MAAIVAILAVNLSAQAQFSGGSGTSGDPYIISTATELEQMATYVNSGDIVYNAAHYELGDNIDLSDYGDGQGWEPIGGYNRFYGVFNGNGKVITGLYINRPGNSTQGLFAVVENATIENLGIEGVNINGHAYSGGVAGGVTGSIISNCYVTGTISSISFGIGGIAGEVMNSIIDNCYSTCSVNGNGSVGGIAGYVNNVNFNNCYSTGTISGDGSIGGIAGEVFGNSSINNCYSISAVNGNSAVSGIAGYFSGTLITNCAALNPSIKAIGAFRVALASSFQLSNNIAFDEMLNGDDNTEWESKGENKGDGEDISLEEIHADGTLGGRFTSENGWTTEDGKLPGLFGKTVDMPPHLSIIPAPPVITTTTLPAGTVETAYSQTLTATGTRPITWEIIEGDLPDGLSLSAATISGTPTTAGTFEFTVKAENSEGDDTAELSITIAAAPVKPTITTEVDLPEAKVGEEYTFTFEATGDAPITWTLVGGSSIAGLTLSSTGVLSGVPTAAITHSFSVKATNGAGDDTKQFSITIKEGTGVVETRHTTSLQIYPNPTSGQLIINNEQLIINGFEIFDVAGRVVMSQVASKSIDISHLPSGIYFLKAGGEVFKVVKE